MSVYNWLREFLLGYLPEYIGSSCVQRTRDHFGFLTVNTQNDSMVIPLAFDPVQCHAMFIDDENPSSCHPSPKDWCHAKKEFFAIKVAWSVSSERQIRWRAVERCL